MHQNHKILEINDEENLNKEIITIQNSLDEFETIIKKANDLKDKIEKEINEINKLYDKTIEDLTKTFKRRRDDLEKEELNLKEKLDNEVTKIKEKLELFLENTKNEMTYVSKINKNKKGFNLLFQELMNSIKPSFNEKENEIKFDEYYFNGAPIPKDIEHKDNTFMDYNNIELSWKIDDIKNLDKNKIKYKIELKKENEEFQQIYEGEKNEFIINNLKNNTNYEIRICSIYNEVSGLWSENYSLTTKNAIDSNILLNSNNKNEYLKKIYEWSGAKSLELLYRGSRDGMFSKNFHEKCDDKGATITLFRNDKGNIFGG